MGDINRMELTGGHPGVDFINTLGGLPEHPDDEYLFRLDDLVTWVRRVGLPGTGDLRGTVTAAQANPNTAAAVLGEVHRLRAASDRVLRSRLTGEQAPSQADTEALRDAWAHAVGQALLFEQDGKYSWTWDSAGQPLRRPLWAVTGAVIDLLTRGPLDRLGQCARCRWLFIDTSKNHSRRWCNMNSCGSLTKMRRYRATNSRTSNQAP